MRVTVIGAGPSGLVTLKYLITAHTYLGTEPIEARLFESDPEVGGTFVARTYEDAELVSSKQLTAFSDFRLRDDDPDFVSAQRYIEYLNDYCTHFQLWPHIHLSTAVQSITRNKTGTHSVTYLVKETGEQLQWECDAIAVCSGLHVLPNIPHIPGIEAVPKIMHSSEFKKREQFGVDKTVLVLGSGETGSDVSYLAVTSPTRRVVMCHRNGFHLAPRRNLNPVLFSFLGNKPKPDRLTVPLDNARGSLFDTAYVHPRLRNHTALWTFYDTYVRCILWLTTGTSKGLDQLVGTVSAERDHVSRIFLNKSSKISAYISAPYRDKAASSLVERIRSAIIQAPIPDTQGRQIDLAPWPECIDENGLVKFRNNHRLEYERMKDEKVKPDIVVLCTGYRQEFPFFTKSSKHGLTRTRPYPTAADADVRNIWKRDDPSVGYIGFVRPSLGAIPPLSELQAQLWILNLMAPKRIPRPLLPCDEPHYRLYHPKGSRIHYGIDHESYVYQLALDMDSALGFWEVLHLGWKRRSNCGWRLPIVWALGANYNTKFRLRGPWQWDGAEDVLTTEIWSVIQRRRWFYDHFLLSFLPMFIFGPISLVVYVYSILEKSFFLGAD